MTHQPEPTAPRLLPGSEDVPVTGDATTELLREELAVLHADYNGGEPVQARDWWFTDRLLALPSVRRLLADRQAVQRVEALAEEWETWETMRTTIISPRDAARRVRRALDGAS